MLLVNDLPSIRNDRDFERWINAFNRWDATDSKDTSPVFPEDLLEFTRLLVDGLSIYLKQRDVPPSPTVADSDQQIPEVSYNHWREAHCTTKTMSGTSDGIQSDAKRCCASGTGECKCMLSRVSNLEASMLSMRDNFGKIAENFDCLMRCIAHVDGQVERCSCSPAAVIRKRKRAKTEESMDPAR